MVFADNTSIMASLLHMEVNRSGLTPHTVETVRLNALRSCENCTMSVVALQTQNRSTPCTADLSACFAATFTTRRRLLEDVVVFVDILVKSHDSFTPIHNITCPPPCITFTAQTNVPVVFILNASNQNIIAAINQYFAIAPQQPSSAQTFPVAVIYVLASVAGLVMLFVAFLIMRRNKRKPKAYIEPTIPTFIQNLTIEPDNKNR
jgi:hypothetical protein